MKKPLLLLVVLLCYASVWASTPTPIASRIISEELTQVAGNIKVTVEYSVQDSVYIKDHRFKSQADKDHPTFASLGVPPFVKYRLYVAGDKLTADFSLKINDGDIPFYPVDLNFELEYYTPDNIKVIQPPKNPHPKNDEEFIGIPLVIGTTAKAYFTPYNSLEIWDEADFYNLKRVWLVETDSLQERYYVSRDDIPESNLDDSIDLEAEPWQDDWNMLFIDGLAYAIPMKRNSEPESINQDTTSGEGKNQEANQRDGCGLGYQRYQYTVSGSIASDFINDIRNPASLNLSGLEVKFYENDLLQNVNTDVDDQFLGSTVTNAAGEFTFNFNICQSQVTEGSNIELYLVVKAKDPNHDIKAKTSFGRISGNNLPLFTRRAIIGNFKLGRTENDRISFNLEQRNILDDSHRSVVYVQRAMDFCHENEVDVAGGITIWPYFPMVGGTGFFMPNSLLYLVRNPVSMIADGRPGIYIDRNNSGDENTTYHEFGHYLMWRLQKNNWLNPLTASFVEYDVRDEENPNISWTEGWANGFMAICDMANYEVDQEFQFVENRTTWEVRTNFFWRGVRQGYENITYIGQTLFDLFDGPDKFAAYNIPRNVTVPVAVNPTGMVQWTFDDARSVWRPVTDGASLTLKQICQPLMDKRPLTGGLIQDIDDYFQELLKHIDCQDRRAIKNVFDNNFIAEDASNLNNALASGFSTDKIGNTITNQYNIFGLNMFGLQLNVDFKERFLIDQTELDGRDQSFNLANRNASAFEYISDDLTIRNGASLAINQRTSSGFYITAPGNFTPPSGASLEVSVCGPVRITAANEGSLVLGDESGTTTTAVHVQNENLIEVQEGAELTINIGSSLTIEAGGTLWIRNGARLTVTGNGNLMIAAGGYLCIEAGAEITLQDVESTITANEDNIIIGTNPVLGLAGNCLPLADIPISGEGTIQSFFANALAFDGTNDKASIPAAGHLPFGYDDFTIEVKFQSKYIDQAPVHQTLLSSRTYAGSTSGAESDGFYLGLWSSGEDKGRLFMQLAGTPNLMASELNLFDGKCHHVAVTRQGKDLSFYIDGNLEKTYTSERNIYSSGFLYMGFDDPIQISFNGQIGEVRIWDHARSEKSLTEDMHEDLSGTESGLAGLWSLNGDNDQKITDMSVYGHHGYLGFSEAEEAGDPTWVSINDCGSGFNLRTSGFASGSSDFIINSPIVTNPYDSTYTNPVVVSPNPFENMLTFRVDSDRPEDLTISILNMQGLEVYKESNLRTNTTISIPNDWRAGYYIIRAIYAGRVEERKILKAY